MPRFFTGPVCGPRAELTGEDARHVSLSLRMRKGEALTLCDGEGADYRCAILELSPDRVLLEVKEKLPSAGEPGIKITLYQALPKSDKLEFIIQKAVELGVYRVVPMLTQRCVARPKDGEFTRKLERYARISQQAAKQCGRGRIPEVAPLLRFSEALERTKGKPAVFCYERGKTGLRAALAGRLGTELSVFVGCEGGFDPAEARQAEESGMELLSLGSRILRCETAPLAVLSAILYEAGEM